MSPAIVTLLTDFGRTDTYVGQMKGVMLGIDPTLRLVDLTHEIPPQDTLEGAFQLATAVEAFPRGSVHLAVIDPGVGTERRAIAVQTEVGTFVGPDNGLFTFVYDYEVEAARELQDKRWMRGSMTATFHGRDVFAPFASAIASGKLDIQDVGPALDLASLVRLDVPAVCEGENELSGPIVSIDRFGNCLTLMRLDRLPREARIVSVECGEFRVARLGRTYADGAPGDPVALVGSFGTLELAERDGDAARRWSLRRGDVVTVRTAPGRA